MKTLDWFFEAENALRNATLNFDIDVDIHNENENDEIDTSEYVIAMGGMEHYVIFKDNDSFEKNKTMFIESVCGNIDENEPIQLDDDFIAFKLNFDIN
jgi:hypothetical protein